MPVDVYAVSHRSSGHRNTITMRRLRATLRLLFDGRTADDVATAAGTGPVDEDMLRSVASRARSQYLMERVLQRLPRRKRSADEDRPLPASLGVSGDAAVALAFHVGLGLGAGTIADLLERAPEQVGMDLYKARQAIDLSLPVPCERFTATISRLNDHTLDADERLQYISHLPNCERCPVVVDALAVLDAELRAEVAAQERGIADASLRPRRVRRLLPAVGAAMLAIAVVGGLLALSGLSSGSSAPVPLVAAGEGPEPHNGWLVQQTMNGRLEIMNLTTKETRALGATVPTGDVMRWPILSPSNDRIAGWLQTAAGSVIEVTDLDGSALHSVNLEHSDAYWYLIGWHGDDEMLVAVSPNGPPGETQDEFYTRLASEGQLLAINVATGAERVLYQGNVANVFIAPDGTRAVIAHPYDARWPGGSIEMREFGQEGVGGLLETVERRVAGSTGMWAPDSSAFYFSLIADEELELLRLGPNQFPPSNALRYKQAELTALGRDGELSTLWQAAPKTEIVVSGIAPDSETVVFRSGHVQTSGYFRYIIWHISASGGAAEAFMESPHPSGVWSPDGGTLLWPTATTWYLAAESTDAMGRAIPDIAFVAYDANWQPRTVYGALGNDPIGARVLAWLPDDALSMAISGSPPTEIRGQAAEPAPVVNAGSFNQLVPGSVASPNGQYVTIRATDGEMMIWNTERRQGRRLQTGSGGGTWLPSGDGLLDTARPRAHEAVTRLIFYAPQFTRDTDARYDFRMLNPAGLSEVGAPYYAAPRLSPEQFNASFYVVNPEQRSVSLWVGGWDTEPRQVLRWQVPSDRLLDPPLTAIWADERTLLISQPDDWRDGLPRKTILTRITVDGDDITVEPLIEIGVRPRERGVILWEMELSPDGAQIAYRLRRYGELSIEGGRTDTLHVVDVTDIGSPLELARGAPGDGMAWAKDSRWLVAGTRGRIALMSADGREFSYISPDGARAEHPIWITTHEVWFSLDNGNGVEIWRVRVD